MQLGNNRYESTLFNSRLQPSEIRLGTGPSSAAAYDMLRLEYSYGTTANNGNLLSQTTTVPTVGSSTGFSAVQTYNYDSLNRLKDATEMLTPIGGSATQTWKQTYTFDRYGNRRFDFTSGNTTFPASSCTEAICNPTISTSTNRITSSGWTFDAAGNTLTDANGQSYVYDGENKQVKASNGSGTLGEYWYDGDGKRVKKYVPPSQNDPGETTIFVYDAAGKLIGEYSTVVADVEDAKVAYLTADHLGSPRINTDRDGKVTARHDYHPYGEEITAGRTSHAEYTPDTVRKQFTGYERDGETEVDYAQARFLHFQIGRFQSADPYCINFEFQAEADMDRALVLRNNYFSFPQKWNRYPYVLNNPLNFTDRLGEEVYLTGSAEDQRLGLERMKTLLGKDRFALVTVSTRYDEKTGGNVTVLSLSAANGKKMDSIGAGDEGSFSVVMSDILQSKEVVEYRVAESFSFNGMVDLPIVGRTNLGVQTKSVLEYGGGATLNKDESLTGRVQIFVHPNGPDKAYNNLYNRRDVISSDKKALQFTSDIIDAHEFGHASNSVRHGERVEGSGPALRMENTVRARHPELGKSRRLGH